MSVLKLDPELRAEMVAVAAELDRVRRDVLDPLLRRTFVAMVGTERQYPEGCDARTEDHYLHASGMGLVFRRLRLIENAVLAAQLEGEKYCELSVGWLASTAGEVNLPSDVDARVAIKYERDPMFELEVIERHGHR